MWAVLWCHRPGLFHVAGHSCAGLTVVHDKLLPTRFTRFCPRQDGNKRAMACLMTSSGFINSVQNFFLSSRLPSLRSQPSISLKQPSIGTKFSSCGGSRWWYAPGDMFWRWRRFSTACSIPPSFIAYDDFHQLTLEFKTLGLTLLPPISALTHGFTVRRPPTHKPETSLIDKNAFFKFWF